VRQTDGDASLPVKKVKHLEILEQQEKKTPPFTSCFGSLLVNVHKSLQQGMERMDIHCENPTEPSCRGVCGTSNRVVRAVNERKDNEDCARPHPRTKSATFCSTAQLTIPSLVWGHHCHSRTRIGSLVWEKSSFPRAKKRTSFGVRKDHSTPFMDDEMGSNTCAGGSP